MNREAQLRLRIKNPTWLFIIGLVLSGARYDAVEQVLYLQPTIKGDFRSCLSTATGYGIVGVKKGKPFLAVKSGNIEVKEIKFSARA